MPLRYTGELIDQIRRMTSTEGAGDDYGVPDEEILQYLNDAQDRLQSKISQQHPTLFWEELTFTPVANQEAYDFRSEYTSGTGYVDRAFIYAATRIVGVWYSRTGNTDDYYKLVPGHIIHRVGHTSDYPTNYIIRGQKMLLQPISSVSSGTVRVVYEKRLPDLALRAGLITSTPGTSGNFYTNVTLTTWTEEGETMDVDSSVLECCDYVSVCNWNGYIVRPGMALKGAQQKYDSSTGILSFATSHPSLIKPTDGPSIDVSSYSVDDDEYGIDGKFFIVPGLWVTTHSQLPELCERYLIAYAGWKVEKRDGSSDAPELEKEVSAIENDIALAFAQNHRDVEPIPYTEDID